MEHYRKYLPAIVLCPPTLIKTWEKALSKFGQGFLRPEDVLTLGAKNMSKVSTKNSRSIHAPKIFIVPYTMLSKLTETKKISPRQFGIAIADESHNLKERESQRTICALPYLKNATVTVALTGTPEVNRPVELFTQLNGIRPDVFDDYQGFVRRYCDAKEGRFGEQDVKGSSNETELKNILQYVVMIRRHKSDVLNDLARKCREIKKISADPDHLDDYKTLDSRYQTVLKKIISRGGGFHKDLEAEKMILQTQQYQQTGLCKVKGVVEELEKLVSEARKFSKSNIPQDLDTVEKVKCDGLEVISLLEADLIQAPIEKQACPEVVDCVTRSSSSTLTAKSIGDSVGTNTCSDCKNPSNDILEGDDDLVNTSESESEMGDMKQPRKSRKRVLNYNGKRLVRGKVSGQAVSSNNEYPAASKRNADDTEYDGVEDSEDEFLFIDKPIVCFSGSDRKDCDCEVVLSPSTARMRSGAESPMCVLSDEEDVKKSWQNILSFSKGSKKRDKKRRKVQQARDISGSYIEMLRGKKNSKAKLIGNFECCSDEDAPSGEENKKKYNGLLHKIVVFAHHKIVMDALEVLLFR